MAIPSNDERRHVLRYDEHMPEDDDISLIVLKGHLLIEEMLLDLASLALEHPEYIKKVRLSFHELACMVRALISENSDDKCWEVILKINSLRNKLAHKLDPPDLQRCITEILDLDKKVQPIEGINIDKCDEHFEPVEGLRQAIVSCMQFLRGAICRRSATH